jgi:ribosomal protein S18 acetylase RimI-like enzyme
MWTIRKVPLDQMISHVEMTMQGVSGQRVALVFNVVAAILRQHKQHELVLLQASPSSPEELEKQSPIGLLVAKHGPDAANLLAFGPETSLPKLLAKGQQGEDSQQSIRQRWLAAQKLFVSLEQQLSSNGICFLQAMREGDDDAELLDRLGFEKLASLDYLVAAANHSASEADASKPDKASYHFVSYLEWAKKNESRRRDPVQAFTELIDRTYEGSLDCPRFARYRSTDQVVQGYYNHPQTNVQLWQIVNDAAGKEVACMVLTAHPASGCMEISYMGVVPQARGKGLGGQLVAWAKGLALRSGFPQLSLAVDQANHYAQTLYRSQGFQSFLTETTWGKQINAKGAVTSAADVPV